MFTKGGTLRVRTCPFAIYGCLVASLLMTKVAEHLERSFTLGQFSGTSFSPSRHSASTNPDSASASKTQACRRQVVAATATCSDGKLVVTRLSNRVFASPALLYSPHIYFTRGLKLRVRLSSGLLLLPVLLFSNRC